MSPTSTRADLCYVHTENGEKPYYWINDVEDPPKGFEKRSNLIEAFYDTEITNIREHAGDYKLDSHGFQPLLDSRTSMEYEDWNDEEKIKAVYYREVEDILKKQTGAHKVTIFDHTIRRRPKEGTVVPDTPSSRQPVPRCHVDQTEASAIRRVQRHDTEEADELLKGRVRLINVWRPFRKVIDMPLAVADFNSVDIKTDLVPSDLIYSKDRFGETYQVNYNANHRWYYVDEMTSQEALLLKCFDSASVPSAPKDNIASLTPHTAFADKRYIGQKGIEPRESIEIRALVYSSA